MKTLISCILPLILTSSASAALLPAGTKIPAGVTGFDPAAGALLASTGAQPFVAATFSGVLQEDVRQESLAANPLGGLTFAFYLSNDSVSITDIERLTTFDFGGFTVDATFYVPGASQSPLDFTRSGSTGHVIGADFGLAATALNPGESASVVVLRTNAPAYRPGINSVIDSGTATLQGYAPIPEPTSAIPWIAGTALFLRRRKK